MRVSLGTLPQRTGLDRGCREASLGTRIDRRDVVAVQHVERRVHVVDLDLARDVGTPEPELPGRAQDVTERQRRAQPKRQRTVAGGGLRLLPSHSSRRNGRSGSSCASELRSASVACASLTAVRSGALPSVAPG